MPAGSPTRAVEIHDRLPSTLEIPAHLEYYVSERFPGRSNSSRAGPFGAATWI